MKNAVLLQMTTIVISVLMFSAYAEDVNLSGIVKNSTTQKAIAGAIVSLKGYPNISDITDANGEYTLSGATSPVLNLKLSKQMQVPSLKKGILTFQVTDDVSPVNVDIYNLNGHRVTTIIDTKFTKGEYRVDLFKSGLSKQFYIVKLQTGSQSTVFEIPNLDGSIGKKICNNNKADAGFEVVANRAVVNDTIVVTASGYKPFFHVVTSYTGALSLNLLSNSLQGLLHITSVSPGGINNRSALSKKAVMDFVTPTMNPRFINSGTPDYLKVTLQQIRFINSDSITDTVHKNVFTTIVWQGSKTLKLTGEGNLDVGDIILDSIPTCKITGVELLFEDKAVICGKLTSDFNVDTTNTQFLNETKTFYTKSSYAYDASVNTGGADSSVGRYAAFATAPAESMSISLQASKNNVAMVTTAVNYIYDSLKPAPALTIVFDLSRVLRFYNGCNLNHEGGVNGNDPANRAYFFCHSVFSSSVAAFFGEPGQIQGYESIYNCTEGNCGVPGWMTIICNPAGQIISGILIGNDDNDFTVAKGCITSVTGDNPVDFHYNISNVDITGFTKGSVLGDSSVASWHQIAVEGGNPQRTGLAKYTLRFKTN